VALGPLPPSAKMRHLSGVTSVLLTACLGELAPDDPELDRHLAHAEACFVANDEELRRSRSGRNLEDDAWFIPWVRRYEAWLALARGRLREAQERAEQALALAAEAPEQDRDDEVIADCAEICGDVRARSGDFDGAFRRYAQAMVSALAFQTRPCPDDYTRTYYDDLAGRVVARARELAARDARRAAAACLELHRFWQPAWDHGQTTVPPRFDELLRSDAYGERRLRAALVPPGPPPAGDPAEAAYVDRAARVYRELRGAVLPRTRVRRRSGSREDRAVGLSAFLAGDDPAWPGWWQDAAIPQPWEAVDAADLDRRLEQEVARLPDSWRAVLRRRDVEARSAREVEEELGIAEDDQLVILHRARARIRDRLDAELRGR
jgi:DNA-directed RNA polymerase specialized sigma24 family protein